MSMAIGFTGARRLRVLAALVAVVFAFHARADDAQEQPARPAASAEKAPSGQKGGEGGRGGGQAVPSAAEQHRLPPDSTTKHTLALPERTLSFAATAGSIRLFDDKGEPQADIAYTSYQLDGADRR